MKISNNKKTVSLAIGSLIALSFASSSVFAAQANPFGMANINHHTYQVASNDTKCGEGKCGASKAKMKSTEGKCGASKDKMESVEGKCGASKDKMKSVEDKCGASKTKMESVEGKCGASKTKSKEAKCGGN